MKFKGWFDKLKSSASDAADAIKKHADSKFGGADEEDNSGMSLPPEGPPPARDASSSQAPIYDSTPPAAFPSGPNVLLPPGRNPRDTASSGPLQVADEEDSVYVRRQQQIDVVQSMFADFGPKICTYLLTKSLQPGGMTRVAQQLGLTPRGRDGADMALVEGFLRHKGPEAFAKATGVKLSTSDPSASRAPVPSPESSGDPRLRVKSISVSPGQKKSVGLTEEAEKEFRTSGKFVKQSTPATPSSFEKRPPPPPAPVPDPPSHAGANPPPSHLRQVTVKPMNLRDPANQTPPPSDMAPKTAAPDAAAAQKTSHSADDFLLRELEESSRKFPAQ